MTDHRALHDRLGRAVRERDTPAILAMVDELVATRTDPHVLGLVVQAAALVPGPEASITAVELWLQHGIRRQPGLPGHADGPARTIAARLAYANGPRPSTVRPTDLRARLRAAIEGATDQVGDPSAVLEAVCRRWPIDDPRTHEVGVFAMLACFVHESILRGVDLSHDDRAHNIRAHLVAITHPLGALPLRPLAIEHGLASHATTYSAASASGWGYSQDADRHAIRSEGNRPAIGDVTAPDDQCITAVFDSHRAVSNGKAEARVLALDPPWHGDIDDALVRSIAPHTECLLDLDNAPPPDTAAADVESAHQAGVDFAPPPPLAIRLVSVERAFATLLSFGANGGDYNTAWSGAYGRLAAWSSLAGLVDAPAPVSEMTDSIIVEIEARARACRFATFDAESSWFYRVVTDLGMIAIRADGASLALLAGSDSD